MSLDALVGEAARALAAARRLFGAAPVEGSLPQAQRLVEGRQAVDHAGRSAAMNWQGAAGQEYAGANAAQVQALTSTTAADDRISPALSESGRAAANGARSMDNLIAETRSGVAALAPSTGSPAGQRELARYLGGQLGHARAVVQTYHERGTELGTTIRSAGYGSRGPLADSPPPPPPPGPVPDPVGKLNLPDYHPGSLSDQEARGVYAQGKLRIDQLDEQLARQGVSLEQRARTAYELRNSLRSWCRDISANRGGAESLDVSDPNKTWEQLVEKYEGQGFKGDDLWNRIIKGSMSSRTSVDDLLGIDPKNPPPLPPVRAPVEAPPVPPPEPPVPKPTPGEGGVGEAPIFGGPAGMPIGPHFIHPPGSIDHPFPILGEDDPDENPRDFRH